MAKKITMSGGGVSTIHRMEKIPEDFDYAEDDAELLRHVQEALSAKKGVVIFITDTVEAVSEARAEAKGIETAMIGRFSPADAELAAHHLHTFFEILYGESVPGPEAVH